MRVKSRLLFVIMILAACSPTKMLLDSLNLPDDTAQIILVTTPSWDRPAGTLRLFEKSRSIWQQVDENIPVTIGRNGLAWGQGLHANPPSEYEKAEGDGKSPAGIYEIGDAYGDTSEPPAGLKLNYKQATERDYFVDDPNSEDYNQWVTIPENEPNQPRQKWSSFERMKLKGHQYELGFVVRHNMSPIVSGKGSAIFFHIWRDAETATAGCTAMTKSNLEKILRWLDPAKKPLVIQIPENEFGKLKLPVS